MRLNVHLHFHGQCEAAFAFYEKCLGGKITGKFTYGGSPMGDRTPPGWENKIMHETLVVGEDTIMGADVPAEMYKPAQGFTVAIVVKDTAEGERLFTALSENATVQMPFQKTFWSAGYGCLIDQFGQPWEVNTEMLP